jgi:hypothetical protein
MSLDPSQQQRLRALREHLRRARSASPELMADVIGRACPRFPAHPPAAKARVIRLIEAGAFADATLALLELELPQWKLRRIVYEDGEWICSLSRHRQLPDWLDDAAEARHATLPLAILAALAEAQGHAGDSRQAGSPTVPQVRSAADYVVCCDNFA